MKEGTIYSTLKLSRITKSGEMNILKFLTVSIVFCITFFSLATQESRLLINNPGTFKIETTELIGLGPDQYNKSCGYTKAESDAATKNLILLIDIFRRCPVLNDIKGFDGYCDINGGRCSTKFGYGLPSTPCFFFETWSLRKGKEVKWTVEPPQWRFEVNMTEKSCSNGFNVLDYTKS